MTGNTLRGQMDLVDLVVVGPRPGWVINNGHRSRYPCITTTTSTTTIRVPTTRPSDPELGWVTFTSGRSYLRLPQWSPDSRSRIEFSFKTIQRHGLMMVSSPRRGRPDFFAVELSDGDLYVLFNLGGRTQRFLVGTGVDDGQEHHVMIDRNGRSLYFILDREQHEDRLDTGDDGSLDLGSTFYVGGTSNRQNLPWPLYSRLRDFYRGCIWDLRLDGGDVVELQRLMRQQGMPGISDGCVAMPHECTAGSCDHDGVCEEHWDGHQCDCALTHYTDARCQTGQSTWTTWTGTILINSVRTGHHTGSFLYSFNFI